MSKEQRGLIAVVLWLLGMWFIWAPALRWVQDQGDAIHRTARGASVNPIPSDFWNLIVGGWCFFGLPILLAWVLKQLLGYPKDKSK